MKAPIGFNYLPSVLLFTGVAKSAHGKEALGLGPTKSGKCIRSGKAVRALAHVLNKCLNSDVSGHTGRKSLSDVVCIKVYRLRTDRTALVRV